jgi:integrase
MARNGWSASIGIAGRHGPDYALFARYLLDVAGIETGDLSADPDAWAGVSWGLVEGFRKWMLDAGYAIGTVNVNLSAVKSYAKLATKAGALDKSAYAMIALVQGYSHKEARNLDEGREITRLGDKKPLAIVLTKSQAEALKSVHSETPRGRRDRAMVALLLGLGLRCGEVSGLQVEDVDLDAGTITFYRRKVDLVQTHALNGAREAVAAYLEIAPTTGPLLRACAHSGQLNGHGMSTRSITQRVRSLGERVGVVGLSAHDLRHTWATLAARAGTPLERLMDAGGWSSPAMPMRYIQAARIANEGVRLE